MVSLGKIVNTHGIRGELRVLPFNPATEALRPGIDVGLRRAGTSQPARVRSVRPNKNLLLVGLDGIDSMTAAEAIVGCEIEVPEDSLPAPDEGEVYHFQLLGLEVVTLTGERVGVVEEIFSTGANDVCVVRDGGREHLIPFVDAIIRKVDLEARQIVIDAMPGLLD